MSLVLGRGGLRTASKDVLEAHIKGGVGVRCKDGSGLSNDISRASILVANGIANLNKNNRAALAFPLYNKTTSFKSKTT